MAKRRKKRGQRFEWKPGDIRVIPPKRPKKSGS